MQPTTDSYPLYMRSTQMTSPNSKPLKEKSHPIKNRSFCTIIRTQFLHSHDNEYNRFKREGFVIEHSSDPTDQLSQSLFSTQWSDFNTPSLTIPFVSLIHLIFSLVMKDRLLFVSIHTNLCPTNTLHCYHIYDCEISPYCFIIHSSIHTHGY